MEDVRVIISPAKKELYDDSNCSIRVIPSSQRKKDKLLIENSLKVNLDHEKRNSFNSDVSSPNTSPSTSPRGRTGSGKPKGGWAKIKRELITKQKEQANSNININTSTATTENKNKETMSPTSPPKSPAIGRKTNYDYLTPNSTININDKKKAMKILVLGQDGVGKSAFIVRYLTRRFIGEYDPHLEGIFRKSITLNNQEIAVEIKDTTRGVNWSKRTSDILWANGIIFLYSTTSRSSFNEIQNLVENIEQQKKKRVLPFLIIGNKRDLVRDRKVSFEEGNKLASKINGTFYELSVSDNYIDLENAVNHFVKEHCHGNKTLTSQLKMLSSRSSPEIRQKFREDRPFSQPDLQKSLDVIEEAKSERGKGRALWLKLKSNNNEMKRNKKTAV